MDTLEHLAKHLADFFYNPRSEAVNPLPREGRELLYDLYKTWGSPRRTEDLQNLAKCASGWEKTNFSSRRSKRFKTSIKRPVKPGERVLKPLCQAYQCYVLAVMLSNIADLDNSLISNLYKILQISDIEFLYTSYESYIYVLLLLLFYISSRFETFESRLSGPAAVQHVVTARTTSRRKVL